MSGDANSQPPAPPSGARRRVKLYVLNDDRQWDDRGTGYVSSAYVDRPTGVALWVVSEADGSTLLESRIRADTAYQKQQETLIVWSEAEALDLALSFQEREGCEEVWARICWVQGKDPSVEVTQDVAEDAEDEDELADEPADEASAPNASGGGRFHASADHRGPDLPPCELGRLPDAARLLVSAAAPRLAAAGAPPSVAMFGSGRALAEAALRRDYPARLCGDIFPAAESAGDVATLQLLHELATCLLLLNHRRLLEALTSPDDRLLSTLGMLEYRPGGRVAHREFVLRQATHRQVLTFSRPGLADRIRHQYRLQYLLDCALPPPSPLDDVQFLTLALRGEGGGGGLGQQSELGGMVLTGRLQIAAAVMQDACLVSELLAGLADPPVDCPPDRTLDLARFLRELCCCCPSGQCGLSELASLQERLLDGGRLLDALAGMCRAADACPAIGAAATDVLQCLVDHSAPLLRDHLLQEGADENRPDSQLLLSLLVDRMRRDADPEMGEAHRMLCLIRALLDPDAALTNPAGSLLCPVRSTPVRPEFLRFFYQRVMPRLLEPLLANTAAAAPDSDDTDDDSDDDDDDGSCSGAADDSYRTALLQHHILGLAAFSVEQHACHLAILLVAKDFVRRALRLLRSRHAFLVLAAVRFFRRIVAAKDELLNRCLMRQRLFRPVVGLLTRGGGRYNLVNSAVLELFEYILLEDIGPLIVHVVENHWPALEPVAYVATFRSLRLRYEQLKEKARECKRPPDSPIVALRCVREAGGAAGEAAGASAAAGPAADRSRLKRCRLPGPPAPMSPLADVDEEEDDDDREDGDIGDDDEEEESEEAGDAAAAATSAANEDDAVWLDEAEAAAKRPRLAQPSD